MRKPLPFAFSADLVGSLFAGTAGAPAKPLPFNDFLRGVMDLERAADAEKSGAPSVTHKRTKLERPGRIVEVDQMVACWRNRGTMAVVLAVKKEIPA